MNWDKVITALPGIGFVFEKMYAYFKQNIFFADIIHIILGLGMGLIAVGVAYKKKRLVYAGVVLFGISILGHIWAFFKG